MYLVRRTLLSCIAFAIIAQSNGQDLGEIDLVPTYTSATEILYRAALRVGDRLSDIERSPYYQKFSNWLSGKSAEPVEENTSSSFSDFLNKAKARARHVLPGTLWCGAGSSASDDNELGKYAKSDACCREHDNCSEKIDAGKSRDHLLNDGAFTRSACSCDLAFYQCLRRVNSYLSIGIGKMYFTFLRPQCFRLDYPTIKCLKQESATIRAPKCLKWLHDETENKTLQWFDTPDFRIETSN